MKDCLHNSPNALGIEAGMDVEHCGSGHRHYFVTVAFYCRDCGRRFVMPQQAGLPPCEAVRIELQMPRLEELPEHKRRHLSVVR